MNRQNKNEKDQALLERLAAFTPIYKKASQDFLASLDERYPEAQEKESGYWNVYASDGILECVPDEWADVTDIYARTLREGTDIHLDYMNSVLEPIRRETEQAFENWWKKTYRQKGLDFNMPSPPDPLPREVVKVDARTFKVGQLTIVFEGDKSGRRMVVSGGGYSLDREHAISFDLKDAKAVVQNYYLPRLLPMLRLCDWEQLPNFTTAQKSALVKRYQAVKKAQSRIADKGLHSLIEERSDRWMSERLHTEPMSKASAQALIGLLEEWRGDYGFYLHTEGKNNWACSRSAKKLKAREQAVLQAFAAGVLSEKGVTG